MVTRIPFNGRFRISQPYANINKSLYGKTPHTGVDLVGESSIKVYATMKNGIVKYVGYEKNGFGNYVKITDLATGNYHYFAHLKSVYVKKGDKVTYTTVIGLMGSTGNSTGPHTHYEIRKPNNKTRLNPCEYMGIPNKRGTYNSKDFPYPFITDEQKQEELDEMKAIEMCEKLEKEIYSLTKQNEKLNKEINNIKSINKRLENEVSEKQDEKSIRIEPYDWEKEAVSYCIDNGIIKGDGEKIDLNRLITLGEMAVIIYRVINSTEKED